MTRSALIRTLLLSLMLTFLVAPTARAAAGWRWPVEGELLTKYRNGDDPYAGGQHRGIDVAAPAGTAVAAASGGTVTFAGTAGDSGLTVSIRTSDGAFDTSYLHLSELSVRRGDEVSAGDAVGAVGTTGRRSAQEPHLHFGVRVAGLRHGYRDPLTLLPPRPTPNERPAAPRAVPVVVSEPLRPVAAPAANTAPAPAPALVPAPALAAGLGAGTAAELAPASATASVLHLGQAPAAASVPDLGAAPDMTQAAAPPYVRPRLRPALPTAPPAAASPAAASAAARPRARSIASGVPPAPRSTDADRSPSAREGSGASASARAGELGPGSSRARRAAPAPGSPAAGPAPRPTPPAGGLDLGWLVACAGLVAAAMLLGAPRGPLGSLRRGRAFAAAACRGAPATRQ